MYNTNSVRRDVERAFDELESAVQDLESVTIEDISSAFDGVKEKVEFLDSELRYLKDEHEEWEDELSDWRELGDTPDDVAVLTEEESEEYAELKDQKMDNDALKARVRELEEQLRTIAYAALQGIPLDIEVEV